MTKCQLLTVNIDIRKTGYKAGLSTYNPLLTSASGGLPAESYENLSLFPPIGIIIEKRLSIH